MILALQPADRQAIFGYYDALLLAYETHQEAATFSLATVVAEARRRIHEQLDLEVTRGRVEAWLARPDLYSPHVDLIAIERAMMFDWSAISRLTLLEWDVFLEELSTLSTPFGAEGSSRRDAWDRLDADQRTFITGSIELAKRRTLGSERRAASLAA